MAIGLRPLRAVSLTSRSQRSRGPEVELPGCRQPGTLSLLRDGLATDESVRLATRILSSILRAHDRFPIELVTVTCHL